MSNILVQEGLNSQNNEVHAGRARELVRAAVHALHHGECLGQSVCEEVTLILNPDLSVPEIDQIKDGILKFLRIDESGIKDWLAEFTLSVEEDNNRLGRLRLLQMLVSTRNCMNTAGFPPHLRNVLTMQQLMPCA